MEILLLHAMSDLAEKIESVKEHELLLPLNDMQNRYAVINVRSNSILNISPNNFDGIVFTSTFFDLLVDPKYEKIISYISEIIITKKAFKLALPQDDYWISQLRDKWLVENEINLVISCLDPENWSSVYPEYEKKGLIRKGYTSYINNRHYLTNQKKIPTKARNTDIFYRTSYFPYLFNELGIEKSQLGINLEKLLKNHNSKLNLDIMGKLMLGEEWLQQMMNSKSVISTASGSSLLYKNRIPKAFEKRTKRNYKHYSDLKIQEKFPKLVEKKTLTALGPRNLEASAVGCLQFIAWPTNLGPLEPYKHFIPFEMNEQSIKEMEKILSDWPLIDKITQNNWETLSNIDELQTTNFVNMIRNFMFDATITTQTMQFQRQRKRVRAKILYLLLMNQRKFKSIITRPVRKQITNVKRKIKW